MSRTRLDGDGGDPTGVPCPRCGAQVVYNGNYFCERWAAAPTPAELESGAACGWAMTHDDETGAPTTAEDSVIWRTLCERYPKLRHYLETHPEEA